MGNPTIPHLHQQDFALDAGRHHTPIRTWSIGTSWESTSHRLETGFKQLPTPSSWLKQPETMGLRHCPAATHCLRWLEDFQIIDTSIHSFLWVIFLRLHYHLISFIVTIVPHLWIWWIWLWLKQGKEQTLAMGSKKSWSILVSHNMKPSNYVFVLGG